MTVDYISNSNEMDSSDEYTSSPRKRSSSDKGKSKRRRGDIVIREGSPDYEDLLNDSDHQLPLALPAPDDVEDNIDERILWPKEDLKTLVDNVSQLLPKNDDKKWSYTNKKINWDIVTFNQYTPDECKAQWDHLTDNLRHFRTLTEIVQDAREFVVNPKASHIKASRAKHPEFPKRPLNPYFRFFLEKRAKLAKKHPEMNAKDLAKVLAERYGNLSEKRKAKLQSQYEQEVIEYKEKLKEFALDHPEFNPPPAQPRSRARARPAKSVEPAKPRTPFQVFLQEKQKKREESVTRKEYFDVLRKLWNDMSDSKRIKWIKKALAEEENFMHEAQAYKEQHPEYEIPVVKILNKAERDLKERNAGRPERPPTTGYSLFAREMMKEVQNYPAKDRVPVIAKKWSEMTQEEKDKWIKQVYEDMLDYNDKLRSYLKTLSPAEREKVLAEEQRNKVPSNENLMKKLTKIVKSKN
ncbi:nucleolar transcription factor 1-like [Brevipalpus obovatus]|uniref:nucleolar transcription factor 1-like n=1 Tax=Brevipalpus obovatus TaxID=246614 RepID=UPI003D9FA02A